MPADLVIAALIGFVVGSVATIVLLSLCTAGKEDHHDS